MSSSSPGITIDIQKNTGQGAGSTTYGGTNNQDVRLTKEEDPAGSGFWKFKHTSATGAPFQVKEVQHNGKDHRTDLGINTGDKITQLSVWYWYGADNMNQPLLAEVLKERQYTYKSAKPGDSISWTSLPLRPNPRRNPLTGKTLETQLDGLNCSLNKAITLNLSHQNSHDHKNRSYCCDYHKSTGEGKVSVTLWTVRCRQNHQSAGYFKHKVNFSNGWRIAAIKYDPTRKLIRNRISLDGQTSPNVRTVYTFNCGENPVLIYVDEGTATGWYKKSTGTSNGNTDEWWTNPSTNLDGITPESITECTKWTALKDALREVNCNNYPKCPQEHSQSSSQQQGAPGPSGSQGPPGSDGANGGDGSTGREGENVKGVSKPGKAESPEEYLDQPPVGSRGTETHEVTTTDTTTTSEVAQEPPSEEGPVGSPEAGDAQQESDSTPEPSLQSDAIPPSEDEAASESSPAQETAEESNPQHEAFVGPGAVLTTGSALAGYVSSGVFAGAGGLTGFGTDCIAPQFYFGPCDTKLHFDGMSLEEKSEVSKKCELEWNTVDFSMDSLMDWNATCPLGYDEVNGECVIKKGYNGMCPFNMTFKNKSEKMEMAKKCNLWWPLKVNNQEHLKAKCPFGWEFDVNTNLCLAPPSYDGPCQLRIDFSGYSEFAKGIWSVICGADFLILDEEKEPKETQKYSDVMYADGPIEPQFKIVKKRKASLDNPSVSLMNKQLSALLKLRNKKNDEHFTSTLEYSIKKLEGKIREKQMIKAPSFLQLESETCTRDPESCPYNWDTLPNACVAPSGYRRLFRGCFSTIKKGQEVSEHCRVSYPCKSCQEDFTRQPCPLGWKFVKEVDGDMIRTICKAPIGLKGYRHTECGSKVDFTNISPSYKRHWTFVCGAKFPCMDEFPNSRCVENYFGPCPSEWTSEDSVCHAPEHYKGGCETSIPFASLSTPEVKQAFSIRCNAPWPCVDNCEKDYSGACPKDWTLDGNSCIVNSHDRGLCNGRIEIPSLETWSEGCKQETEFRCKVYWPCKDIA